jgi:hypothetical protein
LSKGKTQSFFLEHLSEESDMRRLDVMIVGVRCVSDTWTLLYRSVRAL